MHFQWEILGIIPKRLERISSFDLDSAPEKIKLRKKSNREFSVQGREQDWAADRVLGERKGKPRCWPACEVGQPKELGAREKLREGGGCVPTSFL